MAINLQEFTQDFIKELREWNKKSDEYRKAHIEDFPLIKICLSKEKMEALFHVFRDNPQLIDEISEADFNQVIFTGSESGNSLALYLAGTTKGRALLNAYPRLIDLISEEAFTRETHAAGPEAGKLKSLAYYLAITPEGRAFLNAHPRLVDLISKEAFNRATPTGPDAGKSLAFYLAITPEGRAFLNAYPRLVDLISEEAFNRAIPTGPDAGKSMVFYLAISPEGRAFLNAYPRLIQLISVKAMNQVFSTGPVPGQSAVFYLIDNPDGLDLLDKYPALLEKVTAKALNRALEHQEKREMTLFFMMVLLFEGRKLLVQLLIEHAFEFSPSNAKTIFNAFYYNRIEPTSQLGLAYCYAEGIGCEKDLSKAFDFYKKLEKGGYQDQAKLGLATLLCQTHAGEKALTLYHELFASPSAACRKQAKLKAAEILWQQCSQNLAARAKVFALYQDDDLKDSPQASLGRGKCYLFGVGTDISFSKAKKSFEDGLNNPKASNTDIERARNYLKLENSAAVKQHYAKLFGDKLKEAGFQGAVHEHHCSINLSAEFIQNHWNYPIKEELTLVIELEKIVRLMVFLPKETELGDSIFIDMLKQSYTNERTQASIKKAKDIIYDMSSLSNCFKETYADIQRLINQTLPKMDNSVNRAQNICKDRSLNLNPRKLKKAQEGTIIFEKTREDLKKYIFALNEAWNQFDKVWEKCSKEITRKNLRKAIDKYKAGELENGDILSNTSHILLTQMQTIVQELEELAENIKNCVELYAKKCEEFEKNFNRYCVQNSSSEATTELMPDYLTYIEFAAKEYADYAAMAEANRSLETEVVSQEEGSSFNSNSPRVKPVEVNSEPHPFLSANLSTVNPGFSALPAASPGDSTSSGSASFTPAYGQMIAPFAFVGQIEEARKNLKRIANSANHLLQSSTSSSSNSVVATSQKLKVVTYAMLGHLIELIQGLQELDNRAFPIFCTNKIRNVMYHAKKLPELNKPENFSQKFISLCQGILEYLDKAKTCQKMLEWKELSDKFNAQAKKTIKEILSYEDEDHLSLQEHMKLIEELNECQSLAENIVLLEEMKKAAVSFILGRKGALINDLSKIYPEAYRKYCEKNIDVASERRIGNELRHPSNF